MKDNNIAFIGLGNVGSKLAKSILLGRYNLFIHDLKKNVGNKLLKKGAIWSNNLKDLCKNLSDEKVIYDRENQLNAFKLKIKPILGRSVKDEELGNIIKLKSKEFEDIIKKKFDEFRN